uniref:(northern house mosquito) hypothetical protein n=1 Tax=Culex pipiens TaxID=7175 RepID=A0A8D8JP92_CULPI
MNTPGYSLIRTNRSQIFIGTRCWTSYPMHVLPRRCCKPGCTWPRSTPSATCTCLHTTAKPASTGGSLRVSSAKIWRMCLELHWDQWDHSRLITTRGSGFFRRRL